MRISNKLKLLAASMLVAPAAVTAAYAQSADDLNAQALADFRTGGAEITAETGAAFDGSDLDPRGEGDIDATMETEAGADIGAGTATDVDAGATVVDPAEDAEDAAEDTLDDAEDTAEDAGDVEDAADETGDDLEEAGEETGEFFDDLGDETADEIDETTDETDGFIDETGDDIEDSAEDLDDPMN
jgi:hypothetical protein